MSKSEVKPETHYGVFIIIMIVIGSGITGLLGLNYLNTQYNSEINAETKLISNMSCSQLWDEENNHWGDYSWFSARFNTVREKYHEECAKKTFGDAEASTDQQDAYFLSLDCKTLQTYIKNQNLYFERAIVDYKEMCKQ